jgi:uncharacterized protein
MKSSRILTKEDAVAAALGGAVLGGGGGGSRFLGEKLGLQAIDIGTVELVSIEEIPDNAVLLTVSAVGAPAALNACVTAADYVNTVRRFAACFDCEPDGIITNECGGSAALNGWIQAAALHLPLVDAPCDGRAHPTGVMGAMSLQRQKGFVSRQVAIGGNRAKGSYLETIICGSLEHASQMIRYASMEAEGLVAVARNPVTAAYAKEHAAIGAIEQSIALGKTMMAAQNKGIDIAASAAKFLDGVVCMTGRIQHLKLETKHGFDVGTYQVTNELQSVELTFWNENMTLTLHGVRLATFPDLIMTFLTDTGMPVTSAEVRENMKITVIYADKCYLRLGSGLRDKELYIAAEQAVEKEIISYL